MDIDATNGPFDQTIIDCNGCVMRHTDACGDCLVSFIVDRDPNDAIVIDVEQERVLRSLTSAGLVPEVRFRTAAG